MMANTTAIHSGFRIIYLAAFFALLAGVFHPFLTGSSIGIVIAGIMILSVGLAGAILLYKAAIYQRAPGIFLNLQDDLLSYKVAPLGIRQPVFVAGGLVLVIISLMYIYQLTGRV